MEKRKKMFGVCQGKSDSSSVNGGDASWLQG